MFVPLVTAPAECSSAVGRWVVIAPGQMILLVDGQLPTAVDCPIPSRSSHFLGVDGETPVWVASVPEVDPLAGEWHSLRELFGVLSDTDWIIAGRGSQVLVWERDHRFCGRCGQETGQHSSDRARECSSCGLISFPRISPAVIMLVERSTDSGPEVLLAWGRQFPGRFFSALAGFVEPGESLEQCVVREVFEETQIVVDQVEYFGSQPWPFPHSLMVGFTARYVSGEIEVQEEEIVEAGWFGPNELPPVPTSRMSIAAWLIEDWLKRLA